MGFSVRHYIDPITGKRDWGLVIAPEGGFMGMHSLSESVSMIFFW